jgi:hypothetical protein
VLGLARAVGETAPLLWTAFGSAYLNATPFDGSQESLPLFVFRNIQEQSEAAQERGFAGGLMLLLVVLALFGIARYIGRDRSRRGSGRVARAPAVDAARPIGQIGGVSGAPESRGAGVPAVGSAGNAPVPRTSLDKETRSP